MKIEKISVVNGGNAILMQGAHVIGKLNQTLIDKYGKYEIKHLTIGSGCVYIEIVKDCGYD